MILSTASLGNVIGFQFSGNYIKIQWGKLTYLAIKYKPMITLSLVFTIAIMPNGQILDQMAKMGSY